MNVAVDGAQTSSSQQKNDSHPAKVNAKVLRRIDCLIKHLSCNDNGEYETDEAIRVLIGAGLERPLVERAFQPLLGADGRSTIDEDEVDSAVRVATAPPVVVTRHTLQAVICAHFHDAIGRMSYFDTMDDATPQERQAVGASRLMIESRIDFMTQSTKAGNTERRVSFDLLHLITIVLFFAVDMLYNMTYLDREPVHLYYTLVAIHAVWLCDVVWNATLPAADAQGVFVTGIWEIMACKWPVLLVDVIALLPVDLILYWYCTDKAQGTFLPFDADQPCLVAFLAWRCVKLVKVVRLKSLFAFVTLDVVTPRFVTIFFLWKPLLHVVAVAVVTVHAATCICLHLLKDDFSMPPQYGYLDQLVEVVSMLTGSGPNVGRHGETASDPVMLTLMVCGLIAQAAVISNLSVTVFRNDVAAMNVQQMRETLSILEHFRVPKDVSTEILSYQLHALNDDVAQRFSALRTLPDAMQKEVLLYVKVAAVNTVKLFTKASHECKMKIAELLVQTVVPPTTDIVAIGDVGEEMFLIAHGYASVIIFNGMTVAMLSRGDYFGEVALLLPNNIRQATVRALTYCDLWVLDKPSFHDIVANFPALMAAMGSSHVVKVDRRDVKEPARSTTPALISVMNTNSNNQSYRSSRKSSGPPEHPMPSKKRQGELGAVVVDKPAVRPSSRPRSPSGAVVSKRRLNSMFVDRNHRSISLIGEDPHVAAMAPFLGEELFVGRQSPRASGAAIEDSQLSRSNRWLPIVNDTVGSSGRYSSYAATSATPLEQHIRSAPTVSSGSPTDGGGGAANTPLRAASASPTAHCGNSAEVPTADEVQRLRDALFKAIELVRALSSETAP